MTTLDEKIASLSPERRRKVEQLAEELIAEERAERAARETAGELLEDPDEGLELSDWAQERLDQADADRAAGRLKTVPLEEAARRLGCPCDV